MLRKGHQIVFSSSCLSFLGRKRNSLDVACLRKFKVRATWQASTTWSKLTNPSLMSALWTTARTRRKGTGMRSSASSQAPDMNQHVQPSEKVTPPENQQQSPQLNPVQNLVLSLLVNPVPSQVLNPLLSHLLNPLLNQALNLLMSQVLNLVMNTLPSLVLNQLLKQAP